MADWFVGPVMDKIINACSVYLRDHYRLQTGMKEELERLRENHPTIQAVVSASTQAQIRDPALNIWIWQLRDAIDEADDVLDDFEYMKLEEQLQLNMEEPKVRSLFNRLVLEPARKRRKACKGFFYIDPNLERLEVAVQKLDRVSAQVNNFYHLVEKKEKKDQQLCNHRASGSFPGPVFIGRDQEKEIVIQWLRKPSNHNLSLLSLVGHGGMGKTTLLQNIFADEITREFDLKIWVCVSSGFQVEEVITDMLKYLNKWSSHLTKLSPLQEELNSVMRCRKFLLVLDDIWEEDITKWEKVLSPLANGNLGSKILVTTRTHAATSMIPDMIIKNKETLTLKSLEEAQCLELLKTHAFSGMWNFSKHKKLMCIAEEIVKKLSGSPLAAKVIGGVLNSNLNESFWMNILNSNILNVEVEPGCNGILHILRLSFTSLARPLQNCFAFCGIFPRDHQFEKDDLVRMWIALGFIQESSDEGETLEEIGGRYFDDLVKKSFFDEFQYDEIIYYKMHDLLHEFAQYISSEECFRYVGDKVLSFKFPKTIRHLFVETENLEVLRMIKDVKNLHSLFLTSRRDGEDFTEILTEIFKASISIRLLFIDSPYLEKMSEAIEKLRHLRYLNHASILTQMPRSLSSLYHLRFIINANWNMRPCSNDFLPADVSNLSNLRHLGLPPNAFSSVPGIGKLRSLQELNEFNVKNEVGYRIGELEHMSELHKLRIHFLENMMDAREARTAKLFEKRKVKDLFLNWGNTVDEWNSDRGVGSLRQNFVNSDLDVNVLENLKPYKNLKSLSIFSHKGVSCATWMYDAVWISNLEYINLNGCSEWETLPPFGQLPHLKWLYLCNMPKAKRLDYKHRGNDKVYVFPSLEVLKIKGLQLLEDWFDGAGAAAYGCFFPCLTELFLEKCPKLQELPYLPHKLKKMKIQNITWKAAECRIEKQNIGWKAAESSIEKQNIGWKAAESSIEKFQLIPGEDVMDEPLLPSSFENLQLILGEDVMDEPLLPSSIEKFPLILGEDVMDEPLLPTVSMTSLERLTICNNDVLVSFTVEAERWFYHASLSLGELSFRGLKSLESLPSSLESLSSLKILRVEKVPQLQQLPRIPASLEELYLEDLESLQCLPSSLSSLSSLNRLWLRSIPLLQSLPELPPSLNSLSLCKLDKLQCLPSSLSAISSLNRLLLYKIPLLQSLPALPSSLYSLDIVDCHPKLMERYKKFSGSDWQKIAHIPLVRINLLASLQINFFPSKYKYVR